MTIDNKEYVARYGWRTVWKWPWRNRTHTLEERLVGLRRIADRLKRNRVWVYQRDEKFKPSFDRSGWVG